LFVSEFRGDGLRELEDRRGILVVVRAWVLTFLLRELMQRLNPNMQLDWPVELGEVRDEECWLLDLLRHWLELDRLRHLDLLEQAASFVLAELGDVANAESVRSLDRNLERWRIIDAAHALHLGEGHEIA